MDFTGIIEKLKKRGFEACSFKTKEDAAAYIDSLIDGATVAIGGSATVDALGVYDMLKTHNKVFWHWKGDKLGFDTQNSEYYLSSVNGMDQDGNMVLIDGNGNRTAAVQFGHKKVFFVVGRNKIAEDAMARARNVAAPKNAARFNKQTPCVLSSEKRCYDCSSPDRICKYFLTIRYPGTNQPMEVVFVDEDLGF